MRGTELEKRLSLVKGTRRKRNPNPIDGSRRGGNTGYNEPDEIDLTYESMFEFASELDRIEASNELTKRAEKQAEHVKQLKKQAEPEIKFIIMEEDEPETPTKPIIMEDFEIVEDVLPFELNGFKRCEGLSKNGQRCKRQAKKGSAYCSAHSK